MTSLDHTHALSHSCFAMPFGGWRPKLRPVVSGEISWLASVALLRHWFEKKELALLRCRLFLQRRRSVCEETEGARVIPRTGVKSFATGSPLCSSGSLFPALPLRLPFLFGSLAVPGHRGISPVYKFIGNEAKPSAPGARGCVYST